MLQHFLSQLTAFISPFIERITPYLSCLQPLWEKVETMAGDNENAILYGIIAALVVSAVIRGAIRLVRRMIWRILRLVRFMFL